MEREVRGNSNKVIDLYSNSYYVLVDLLFGSRQIVEDDVSPRQKRKLVIAV